jgi:hypothetical protein
MSIEVVSLKVDATSLERQLLTEGSIFCEKLYTPAVMT